MAYSSSSSSSCSDSTCKMKYDVFLSFRGEDTRNTFTSHLYSALCRRKIETFIDYELDKGDEISPALSKTIEDSSLSIVILSKNYAYSTWCLNELVKILECKQRKGQIVLPVFYHVLPSDVRVQSGSYKEALSKHEKWFGKTKDKVSSWRAALTEVATLSGWDIKQHDGLESEFIENIVKAVLKALKHRSSYDSLNGLVGIGSHIQKVHSLLCIETTDFRIMGIWGMPGVGKTTLARTVFNRIANHFESSCFLANIREEYDKCGLNKLQKKLLSEILEEKNLELDAFTIKRLYRKKVLIVLDDVNNAQHLKYLIGDHSWYGLGSRIIITSRDKQVLKNGVDECLYELKELDNHNAFKLFSLNAFKQSYPREDYMALSNQVVYYAKGNPLALKVLGCFLQGRSKQEWKSSLSKLKKCPNLEIQNMLRISYDGLDDQEKEIFLDIACCFKGEHKDHVIAILDGYGLSTKIGISVLVDKCLLTVTENKLFMHNLSIYSSCCEALFEFSPVGMDLQPLPNCKIKKCGVHLLYLEEEETQTSGGDSLNEEGLVETGRDSISNVKDQADPNTASLEKTEHDSESADTFMLAEGGVKMMLKKVFLSGLALFSCVFSCGGV